MTVRSLLLPGLVLTSLLAGCIGGEEVDTDPEQTEDPLEVQSNAGLGTIKGTVLTISLDPIPDARVNLVQAGQLIAETRTNSQGRYAFANVEPGEYILQFSTICCREEVRGIRVQANEEVSGNIQLTPLTSDDLQQGRIEQNEWTGFLSCTLRWPNPTGHLPYTGLSACSLYDPTGQDDFLQTWEISQGLKTVVGAMVWDAPGAALGNELMVIMEVAGRSNQPPRYVRDDGPSPLEFRVSEGFVLENYPDNEDVHMYDFSNVEESLALQYRIFAGGDLNVVYQQKFTVYWDLHYWEHAPEHATAVPDL